MHQPHGEQEHPSHRILPELLSLSDSELERIVQEPQSSVIQVMARELLAERERSRPRSEPIGNKRIAPDLYMNPKHAGKRFRKASANEAIRFKDIALMHVSVRNLELWLDKFTESELQMIEVSAASQKVRQSAQNVLAVKKDLAIRQRLRQLSVESLSEMMIAATTTAKTQQIIIPILRGKLNEQLEALSEPALKSLSEDESFPMRSRVANEILTRRTGELLDKTPAHPGGVDGRETVYQDYLKPWSDDFDMPQYDLE